MVHRVLGTGKVHKCDLGNEAECPLEQDDHWHHNLICRTCGAIEEVHCPGLGTLEQRVAERSGFVIEQHRLEFSGICQACQ